MQPSWRRGTCEGVRGDSEAEFAAFYRASSGRLLRAIVLLTGDAADAEDALQERVRAGRAMAADGTILAEQQGRASQP